MATLTFPSGVTLDTFGAPPKDFDVGTASDDELVRYGFGHLVRAPELKARLAAQLRGFEFIEPTFSNRRASPRSAMNLSPEDAAAPVALPAWAGGVVAGIQTDPICWVQGAWTVPSMQPPPGAPSGFYAAAPWVGIDGLNPSIDIVQAGCEAWLKPDGVFYRVWCQWHPDDPKYLDGFPIAPGDAFGVTIRVDPASKTEAAMVIANQSKAKVCNFVLSGMPAYPLVGNCAEWIVELQPQLGLLGNFGVVNFTNCAVGAMSGAITNLATAVPAYMVAPNRRVLAQAAITGPNSLAVRYNPAAV